MNIHFIVTGYLYYWVIIGIDPGLHRVQAARRNAAGIHEQLVTFDHQDQ